jgi:hypothetical protein
VPNICQSSLNGRAAWSEAVEDEPSFRPHITLHIRKRTMRAHENARQQRKEAGLSQGFTTIAHTTTRRIASSTAATMLA